MKVSWFDGRVKPFIVLSVLISVVLLGCSRPAENTEATGEWVWLFDGKTLDGWSVKCLPADAEKQYWSVKDGSIVANAVGNPDHDYVWLMYDQEFSDFELELKFRWMPDSDGNSGVQVRSRWDDSLDAPRGGWLDGPQVDIHPLAPFRIGLIYDETRTEKRWIHPDLPNWEIEPQDLAEGIAFDKFGWNVLRIVCLGTTITVDLNGTEVTSWDGAGIIDDEAHAALNVGMRGHIALQLHARHSLHMEYRDIRLRELE